MGATDWVVGFFVGCPLGVSIAIELSAATLAAGVWLPAVLT